MVSDSCKKRFGKIMMEEMELVAQEEIAPRIYSMILKGEMVAQMLPGQFLHIRVPDGSKLLRRPISISEIDPETQTCRLIYRIEGGGTAIFSQLPIGSKLSVMGPQGNGFDLTNLGQGQKALIIGGGIGVHLACSNMSIPNSMTIPAPTFPWNPVWLVGWGLAMPV